MIDETDDVIDFMIMEAVALRIDRIEKQREKERQAKEFKKDKGGLDKLREIAGG